MTQDVGDGLGCDIQRALVTHPLHDRHRQQATSLRPLRQSRTGNIGFPSWPMNACLRCSQIEP